jgi:hypothetical protein
MSKSLSNCFRELLGKAAVKAANLITDISAYVLVIRQIQVGIADALVVLIVLSFLSGWS